MNHRERIVAVFQGKTVDAIPWVPRIDLWHNAHTMSGSLPEKKERGQILEFDKIDAICI